MSTPKEAEEHLRVIRSLMERATIYRAISAPVALIGGCATLLGWGFMALIPAQNGLDASAMPVNPFYLPTWLTVLAITAIANIYFLWLDAKRRGEAFFSPGQRAAMRALLPGCLLAAVTTFIAAGWLFELPIVWMICYGLSLLATHHFAPRSIICLGWAFLLTGISLLLLIYFETSNYHPDEPSTDWFISNLVMGCTFGVYHIIYAVATWPRKSTEAVPAGES